MAGSAPEKAPANEAASPFPNLPHTKSWIGTSQGQAGVYQGAKRARGSNPPCSSQGQPWEGDPRDEFEGGGGGSGGGWGRYIDTYAGSSNNSLERVTIYGQSNTKWPTAVCYGFECRIYDYTLPELVGKGSGGGSSGAVTDVAVGFLEATGSLIFPILDKCVKVFDGSGIRSPDQDKKQDYFAARSFTGQAYSGNTEHLRRGMRVDVRYPNLQTVRFVISGINPAPASAEDVISDMSRFLDGVPDPQNSPCK
ncbi:hypothetical protein [Paucibacter sp. DJ2R-2]|uniref:hypothetical protein n=1 Tax=Paucibacter sp. DJ2R-2 TaxID=2893558 RepID=UPI0021E3712A|nr:hypothetical protein [Paucibacter sp. DJ2R-2]MCV2420062.1 hypothetical protein [Paucibacter sp. DJ4R-1]MCV2437011.1 hypothetical protein [Paucibacter sp. DJ2R-2]